MPAGRVRASLDASPAQHIRNFGTLVFLVLRDASGIVQLTLDTSKAEPGLAAKLSSVTLESAVTVQGRVAARPDGQANANQPTGEVELEVSAISVDGLASPLPIQVCSATEAAANPDARGSEAARLTHRHLDLRGALLQRNLRVRSAVVHALRCALHDDDFVEVETPTLFRSTPEGAREFLVPSRSHGTVYALTQSPQQHKQLLMAGGMQRYFQVARCYRDEGGRSDRQPEFTQLDLELSWVDLPGMLHRIEGLFRTALSAAVGAAQRLQHVHPVPALLLHPPPAAPLPRLAYSDVMARFGSDRPDRRVPYHISDVTSVFAAEPASAGFKPWAHALGGWRGQSGLAPHHSSVRVLHVPGGGRQLSRKALDTLLQGVSASAASLGSNTQGLAVAAGNSPLLVPARVVDPAEPWTGSGVAKILTLAQQQQVADMVGGVQEGDLLVFAAGWGEHGPRLLGKVREVLASALCPVPPDAGMDAYFVTDFPMFELAASDEDAAAVYRDAAGGEGGVSLKATHHPFTAPADHAALQAVLEQVQRGDVLGGRLAALDLTSAAYDLVVNGAELGGGSLRLHQRSVQEGVLVHLLGLPDHHVRGFEHLLQALEHGTPPHGGVALGLDRTLAVLLGSDSIRDVIAFPKSTGGRDLMSGAPAPPSEAQMAEYGFKWSER